MKWLERDLHRLGMYLILCTDEKSYLKVAKFLKLKNPDPWLPYWHTSAATHHFHTASPPHGKVACVVIGDHPTRSLEWIYATLCHEAVHVWQEHCEVIGERSPSREFMAYGIESIALALMEEYKRQKAEKPKRRRVAKRRKKNKAR